LSGIVSVKGRIFGDVGPAPLVEEAFLCPGGHHFGDEELVASQVHHLGDAALEANRALGDHRRMLESAVDQAAPSSR
jgi:hypothetical protein